VRATEFVSEILDYNEIFKQIDAERAAGVTPKYPVIGGVERTPELIRKEILGGGTLETEPVDRAALQRWSAQQKASQRAGNFLGIGDMLGADEKAGRKLTPNEYRSQNIGTTVPQTPAVKTAPVPQTPAVKPAPMPQTPAVKIAPLPKISQGGGGTNLDRADPNSWRAPVEDPFQTAFDPKRTTDQMRYERLKRGY